MEQQHFVHRPNHSSYSTVRLDDASTIEGTHLKIYGNSNNIKASKSTIYGNDNIIIGSDIQVFGHSNDIKGDYLIIEGNQNIINGHDANVNGNDNRVAGRYAIVHGDSNAVDGDDSKTDGNENRVTGRWTSKVGNYNHIYGKRANVKGNDNNVSGNNSNVVGNHNRVTGRYAVVQGDSNIVDGDDSKAEGDHNQLTGRWSSVVGNRNEVDGKHASAIGDNNVVFGDNSNATGHNNTINGMPSALARILEGATYIEPPHERNLLDQMQQIPIQQLQTEQIMLEMHFQQAEMIIEQSQLTRQLISCMRDGMDLEDEMNWLLEDFGGDDENVELSTHVDTSMHDAWSMELENGVTSMLSSIGDRTPLQPFSLFSVQPFPPVHQSTQEFGLEEEQFPSTHQQPIKLSFRGNDEEIQDENDKACFVCHSNKAVVASDCCGKIATCIECSRTLYEGKIVGQVPCPNCRGTVSNVTRILL